MTGETEFYEAMAARYAALSGFVPDEASDISLRLHTLAEQLALFSKRLETAEQQSRAETASGGALDAAAAARGLFRNPALRARGVLEFTRLRENGALEIPAGTACAAEDGTEYQTTEAAVIAENALNVRAGAQAVCAGRGGNAAPERIVRVLGALSASIRAVNPAAFTGGAEAETDGALRARVLADRANPANGANGAFYEREALAFGGISSAAASAAEGTAAVRLLVAADGLNSVSPERRAALQEKLNKMREPCASVTVEDAQAVPVNVSISVEARLGVDFETARETLTTGLGELLGRMQIGQRLTLARLGQLIMESGLAENYAVASPAADVSAGAGQVLRPGEITVTRMGG